MTREAQRQATASTHTHRRRPSFSFATRYHLAPRGFGHIRAQPPHPLASPDRDALSQRTLRRRRPRLQI